MKKLNSVFVFSHGIASDPRVEDQSSSCTMRGEGKLQTPARQCSKEIRVNRNSSLQAVVFDLDGLMFNTEMLYDFVMQELCRRRKLQFTEDLRVKMMGRPGEKAFIEMIEHHRLNEHPTALLEESDALFSVVLEAQLAPMPGLQALLAALERAAIPKAIGTSSRRKYVDYVLQRFELADRFAFILTAENVEQGKPHPEIYLTACQSHGFSPAQVMVLEDSQNGCRAAVSAGTFAVAVPGEHSRSHSFSGAALIADSLEDHRIYTALGLTP
jgi:HAD superfamily hydrolase (TIGR01509 family)